MWNITLQFIPFILSTDRSKLNMGLPPMLTVFTIKGIFGTKHYSLSLFDPVKAPFFPFLTYFNAKWACLALVGEIFPPISSLFLHFLPARLLKLTQFVLLLCQLRWLNMILDFYFYCNRLFIWSDSYQLVTLLNIWILLLCVETYPQWKCLHKAIFCHQKTQISIYPAVIYCFYCYDIDILADAVWAGLSWCFGWSVAMM